MDMEIRRAYCSATDRNVPVLLKPDARPGSRPSVRDAEALVCLEYGVTCTGAFCPLFDVPVLPSEALLAFRSRRAPAPPRRAGSPRGTPPGPPDGVRGGAGGRPPATDRP